MQMQIGENTSLCWVYCFFSPQKCLEHVLGAGSVHSSILAASLEQTVHHSRSTAGNTMTMDIYISHITQPPIKQTIPKLTLVCWTLTMSHGYRHFPLVQCSLPLWTSFYKCMVHYLLICTLVALQKITSPA